ncbi:hypothetical protein TREES_T100020455 [Tupaia chinensis]|uniref:Uncharacterized protein n=1 Tax=Tupaia chinensis TaxID=246437 RepID=L9KX17_TUPCH|nr:hypothetical protein TREES_T100020455 [Tupaia chinensis]
MTVMPSLSVLLSEAAVPMQLCAQELHRPVPGSLALCIQQAPGSGGPSRRRPWWERQLCAQELHRPVPGSLALCIQQAPGSGGPSRRRPWWERGLSAHPRLLPQPETQCPSRPEAVTLMQ